MYRKQIGRSILFHLIIKRSAARQKEPQLSKEAAPQSFHPAKSPSIVIAVGIQIKIHILYRKQVDRHIIGLFHFFLRTRCLHRHSTLLYPCTVGCWAMIKSTDPLRRHASLRSSKSYPISRKSVRCCFCMYSPMT